MQARARFPRPPPLYSRKLIEPLSNRPWPRDSGKQVVWVAESEGLGVRSNSRVLRERPEADWKESHVGNACALHPKWSPLPGGIHSFSLTCRQRIRRKLSFFISHADFGLICSGMKFIFFILVAHVFGAVGEYLLFRNWMRLLGRTSEPPFPTCFSRNAFIS